MISYSQDPKYKPHHNNLYWDDVLRALDNEIRRVQNESNLIIKERNKISTEIKTINLDITINIQELKKYIYDSAFKNFTKIYWNKFRINQQIKMIL